jgi:hypothetical protein
MDASEYEDGRGKVRVRAKLEAAHLDSAMVRVQR